MLLVAQLSLCIFICIYNLRIFLIFFISDFISFSMYLSLYVWFFVFFLIGKVHVLSHNKKINLQILENKSWSLNYNTWELI